MSDDQHRPAGIADVPLVVGDLLRSARTAISAGDIDRAHELVEEAEALVDRIGRR